MEDLLGTRHSVNSSSASELSPSRVALCPDKASEAGRPSGVGVDHLSYCFFYTLLSNVLLGAHISECQGRKLSAEWVLG